MGAYSIVVSKNKLNEDTGNEITYAAPGAEDKTNKGNEYDSRGAKILLKSFETSNPVRVIRGKTSWRGRPHHGTRDGAPVRGYRYEGLYVVKEHGIGENGRKGSYAFFKLQRQNGQDPIQKKIPNSQQAKDEEKVVKGY